MKKIFILLVAIVGSMMLLNACSHNDNSTSSEGNTSESTEEQLPTNEYGVELVSCQSAMKARQNDTKLIEQDLLGHIFSYEFYGKKSNWKIESGEVQNLKIVSCQKRNDEFLMQLDLTLHTVGSNYTAKLEANYVFNEQKGWEIEFVNLVPGSWNVVRTYKYDNFITTERGGALNMFQYVRNSTDVQLVVYGQKHDNYADGWEKFQVLVPANGTAQVGYDNTEIQIDMVERP